MASKSRETIGGKICAHIGEYIGNVVIISERAPDRREDQPAVTRDELVPRAVTISSRQRLSPKLHSETLFSSLQCRSEREPSSNSPGGFIMLASSFTLYCGAMT